MPLYTHSRLVSGSIPMDPRNESHNLQSTTRWWELHLRIATLHAIETQQAEDYLLQLALHEEEDATIA